MFSFSVFVSGVLHFINFKATEDEDILEQEIEKFDCGSFKKK